MKEAEELPWFGVARGEWLMATGDLKRVAVRISDIVAVVGASQMGDGSRGAIIKTKTALSIFVDQSADEVLRAIIMAGCEEKGEKA